MQVDVTNEEIARAETTEDLVGTDADWTQRDEAMLPLVNPGRWCRGHYCPFVGQSRYDGYCCGRCRLAHLAGGPAGHGPSCSLKVLDAEMWASGSLHGSAAGSANGSAKGTATGSVNGDQLEGEEDLTETEGAPSKKQQVEADEMNPSCLPQTAVAGDVESLSAPSV